MKIKLLGLLVALLFAMVAPSLVSAQDGGQPDSLILLTNRPEAGANDSLFIIELWIWNDVNGVAPQFGFSWESNVLTLDSAKAAPDVVSTFTQIFLYDGNSKAQSNTNKRAVFTGISFTGATLPPGPNRHLVSTYYFTISSWDVASEIIVDSASWDDGSEMLFVDENFDSYIPVYIWGDGLIVVKDPSDVNGANGLPATYSLSQNYPNPFNPETVIDFSLEQAGEFTFTVYNVIGQVVDEIKGMGSVGNNEIRWNGSNQSSGVYFYKLQAGDYTETKKMMLVK
jgi:hypothetical protein